MSSKKTAAQARSKMAYHIIGASPHTLRAAKFRPQDLTIS
jgi:hypothetical protein